MKHFPVRLLLLSALLLTSSCSQEPREYPRDISKKFNPATLSFPCKMVVINNNIQLLSEPYAGSKGLVTYKAGEIVTAEARDGDWLKVSWLLLGHGWIHKDNLQPAS